MIKAIRKESETDKDPCTNSGFKIQTLSYVREQKTLFSNLSLNLIPGELLLVEGANGSGKTSLLRQLAGLTLPTQGEILWKGKVIHEDLANYHANLHYVSHLNGLKLGLTATENLIFQSYLSALAIHDIPKVLTLLQLTPLQHTPANYLSAGQKRRLALAKLFFIPKKLWILDEPFSSLDLFMQKLLLSQLTLHLQQGGIAVLSSHQSISIKNIPIQQLRL